MTSKRSPFNLKSYLLRRGLGAVCILVTVFTLPHRWFMWRSAKWYDGDKAVQARLARGVEYWIEEKGEELTTATFRTGHALYNGEWLFGTYVMAGMGFGQTALEHPEWKARHAALMERCIDVLLDDRVSAFDTGMWYGQKALDHLDGTSMTHAAYLGNLNVLLGLHRVVAPHSKHAALNDRVTSALIQGVSANPLGLLPSYPEEYYPMDNCAVAGSIGMHSRATGTDRSDFLRRWGENFRNRYVERKTGLLIQAVDRNSGAGIDHPRGSGTALGAYWLSFADPKLSAELFDAIRRELADPLLGFGGIKEYPKGITGSGDVDSGPVVFGYGVSPTGFTISLSRIHGDRDLYRRLYASAQLLGAPIHRGGRKHYVMGGSLGDAILFAMLTARKGGG